MNLLAHLFHSHHIPAATVGSLLGDVVKGRPDPRYPPDVQTAIGLHRAIDAFTDSHPTFRCSKRLISVQRRRYAGILVDIFYDYCLSRHWHRYSRCPLDTFIQKVYAHILGYEGFLPDGIRDVFERMVAADWLSAYGTEAGIALTIERVSRRIRRGPPLSGAIEELTANRRLLDDHFLEFFPSLIDFCSGHTGTP